MVAAVLVYPGFDELDAIAPYEVLANAAQLGAELEVRLLVLQGPLRVRGSHDLVVEAHGRLGEGPEPGLVVVPGGGWNDHAPEGARAQAERGELPAALVELHARGADVASVCTGGGILAAAGLLDGRPASTHHLAREELRARGLDILDARVVDDGDVVSAGGVTSGIDLALWLVEREFGRELADRVAAEMEHPRQREVQRGPRAR